MALSAATSMPLDDLSLRLLHNLSSDADRSALPALSGHRDSRIQMPGKPLKAPAKRPSALYPVKVSLKIVSFRLGEANCQARECHPTIYRVDGSVPAFAAAERSKIAGRLLSQLDGRYCCSQERMALALKLPKAVSAKRKELLSAFGTTETAEGNSSQVGVDDWPPWISLDGPTGWLHRGPSPRTRFESDKNTPHGFSTQQFRSGSSWRRPATKAKSTTYETVQAPVPTQSRFT